MITVKEALINVETYLGNAWAISLVRDIGEAYIFSYYLKKRPDEILVGVQPLSVDKVTGKISHFYLPNKENFKRLENAVEIPREEWNQV